MLIQNRHGSYHCRMLAMHRTPHMGSTILRMTKSEGSGCVLEGIHTMRVADVESQTRRRTIVWSHELLHRLLWPLGHLPWGLARNS